MQRIFRAIYEKAPRAESGIVFRRAALRRVNRAHAGEALARRRAKALIRDAAHQVSVRHDEGRLAGYRDGINCFLDVLIAETGRVAETYASDVAAEHQDIVRRVEALFKDTETARALAEEYLQRSAAKPPRDRQITVYVPHWCTLRAEVVDQLQVNTAYPLVMAASRNDRFVISDGQFSISFAPVDAADRICTQPRRTIRPLPPALTGTILSALLARMQECQEVKPR